jgi:hypothetical protein
MDQLAGLDREMFAERDGDLGAACEVCRRARRQARGIA